MKDPLREEARSKLIDLEVGLLSQEELICWADSRILALEENPPDFLISISLQETLAHQPRLDLLKDRITGSDARGVAKRLLQAFEAETVSFLEIEQVATRLSQILSPSDALYPDFVWISDELDLAISGAKEQDRSHQDVLKVLKNL